MDSHRSKIGFIHALRCCWVDWNCNGNLWIFACESQLLTFSNPQVNTIRNWCRCHEVLKYFLMVSTALSMSWGSTRTAGPSFSCWSFGSTLCQIVEWVVCKHLKHPLSFHLKKHMTYAHLHVTQCLDLAFGWSHFGSKNIQIRIQQFCRRMDSGNMERNPTGHVDRQTREARDTLRFIYQTTAKGQGKSYQDWMASWKQCRTLSVGVQANSLEGIFAAPSIFPNTGYKLNILSYNVQLYA